MHWTSSSWFRKFCSEYSGTSSLENILTACLVERKENGRKGKEGKTEEGRKGTKCIFVMLVQEMDNERKQKLRVKL